MQHRHCCHRTILWPDKNNTSENLKMMFLRLMSNKAAIQSRCYNNRLLGTSCNKQRALVPAMLTDLELMCNIKNKMTTGVCWDVGTIHIQVICRKYIKGVPTQSLKSNSKISPLTAQCCQLTTILKLPRSPLAAIAAAQTLLGLLHVVLELLC